MYIRMFLIISVHLLIFNLVVRSPLICMFLKSTKFYLRNQNSFQHRPSALLVTFQMALLQ